MSDVNVPLLAAAIAGALVYGGIVAAIANLGIQMANRLQSVSRATFTGRLVRNWHSWLVPALLIFLAVGVCGIANQPIIAGLLVLPYAYVSAVGIHRHGRA